MTRLVLQTASRLHFGLLAWGPGQERQFGGLGLMIDRPGIELVVIPSGEWASEGELSGRVVEVAGRVSAKLVSRGSGRFVGDSQS